MKEPSKPKIPMKPLVRSPTDRRRLVLDCHERYLTWRTVSSHLLVDYKLLLESIVTKPKLRIKTFEASQIWLQPANEVESYEKFLKNYRSPFNGQYHGDGDTPFSQSAHLKTLWIQLPKYVGKVGLYTSSSATCFRRYSSSGSRFLVGGTKQQPAKLTIKIKSESHFIMSTPPSLGDNLVTPY